MISHGMGFGARSAFPIVLANTLVCIVLWNCSAVSFGQRRPPFPLPSSGELVAKPREVKVLLDDVVRNIADEEWSEATLGLGMLLGLERNKQSETDAADYFLIDEDEVDKLDGPSGSVYSRTLELIESLPSEGSKRMELRYGTIARQGLDDALADLDWNKVTQIAGKYPFTTAGQDACLIMGQHWLNAGEPQRSTQFLKSLTDQKNALERLGPQLGVLTSAIYQLMGTEPSAVKILEKTREQFSRASVDWNGKKIAWDERSKPSQEIVRELAPMGHKLYLRSNKAPLYLGGNSRHNAETSAGAPLPLPRWKTELHESKQHKANLEKSLRDKLNDGKLSSMESKSTFIPTRNPIKVGPWVVTSTYDQRIIGVDALTGVLVWESFYSGMPLGFTMERFSRNDSHSLNLAAPDYLVRRVWGESILGMLSSDGDRVFGISELPAIDVAESFAQGLNARVAKTQVNRNFNVMQCWSAREQGKIKWEVGGLKSPSEPQLAGCLFLGVPLPYDNQLLVMGEFNSDVYLFVLSPETGKLIRRQPIASNTSTIANDQLRRNVGAVPSADGNTVLCPTLSGHLVALDSVTHSLLWSFHYPTRTAIDSLDQFGQWGQLDKGTYQPLSGRSSDVSPLIHEGVVLYAPSDGDGVYAVSLDSGKLLWQWNDAKVDQVRYVAGAWNGSALIACQSSFLILDLKTGKEQHKPIVYPNDEQLVGRGVRSSNAYFLPTSGQEILRIDISKGIIAEAVKVDQPLGNLTSIGDKILSASPFQLDCYVVREAVQSQLKEELKSNSVSIRSLIDQGEIALSQGDFETSLKFLEQAQRLEPANAEMLIKLSKAGIAALTADFDKYVDKVNLPTDLAVERDLAPYLRLLVHGLQKQGRHREAILRLLELSDFRTSQRQDQANASGNINLTPKHAVHEDRWIATQIRRSYLLLSQDDLAQLQPKIAATFASLNQLPAHVRRLKLEHLEVFPQTATVRTATARELLRTNDRLQAEGLLLSDDWTETPTANSPELTQRKNMLAEIYFSTHRYDLALEYLDGDSKRFSELFKVPAEINSIAKKTTKDWPTGKAEVTISNADPTAFRGNPLELTTPCRWKTRIGKSLRDWSISAGLSTWLFSNQATNEEINLYIDVGNQDKNTSPNIYSVDSVVLIELNRQIIAVNTLLASISEQDGLIWRKAFDGQVTEMGRGQAKSTIERNVWGLPVTKGNLRVAAVSRSGMVLLHDDNLICLDIFTGNVAWKLSGYADAQFASKDRTLMVFKSSGQSIVHLDMRDGEIIKEIPLTEPGWSVTASLGKYWLTTANLPKKYGLRLVDATDGRVLFHNEFPSETKIALEGDSSIFIVQNSGDLTYWNVQEEKEFTSKLEPYGRLKEMTAKRFGDVVMLLPNDSRVVLESINLSNKNDPSLIHVSGQIAAVSAKDGRPLWKQANRVVQMFFPLAQDASSPVAAFVRNLELNVSNQNIDVLSAALIDVRDGRILFHEDDLMPVIRNRLFHQSILADKNRIEFDYLGIKMSLTWSDTSDEPAQPKFEFGDIKDPKEFKKQIENKLRNLRNQTRAPADQPKLAPVPNR